MNTFAILDHHTASFKVDTTVYSKNVLTKVLYWLSGEYIISTEQQEREVVVTLEAPRLVEWEEVKSKVSLMLADFQMREVIAEETKDIRNILYVKAFANVDELLKDDEEI